MTMRLEISEKIKMNRWKKCEKVGTKNIKKKVLSTNETRIKKIQTKKISLHLDLNNNNNNDHYTKIKKWNKTSYIKMKVKKMYPFYNA